MKENQDNGMKLRGQGNSMLLIGLGNLKVRIGLWGAGWLAGGSHSLSDWSVQYHSHGHFFLTLNKEEYKSEGKLRPLINVTEWIH